MSRIKWERARKLLDWQFAEPPQTWPVRFTPYQLARLQAHAGADVDRTTETEISALKKAIEGAVKALELPHLIQKFDFPSRTISWGGAKEIYSNELPAIAAGDFSQWLEQQGEAPSLHISAWIASCQTRPETAHPAPTVEAVTPAPVALVESASPVAVEITRKLETNDERGIRLLGWRKEEEKRQWIGAMQRTFLREVKENPHLKNDRSNLGRLIQKAKEQTTAPKRYGGFVTHKVVDGKRQN